MQHLLPVIIFALYEIFFPHLFGNSLTLKKFSKLKTAHFVLRHVPSLDDIHGFLTEVFIHFNFIRVGRCTKISHNHERGFLI